MKNIEVQDFYNKFDKKLVSDFLNSNARLVNAIVTCIENIPIRTGTILDLGYGLGWSTFEFARHFQSAKVFGVDISTKLKQLAESIFQRNNLSYINLDLTSEFPKGKFDVVVLIDVFEHIPVAERNGFYAHLKNCLSSGATILFTCPSIYHQDYLRTSKPDGLQPIDEDVTIETFQEMAQAINAEIIKFTYLSIWKENDYIFTRLKENNSVKYGNVPLKSVKAQLLSRIEKLILIERSNLSIAPSTSISQKERFIYHLAKFVKGE